MSAPPEAFARLSYRNPPGGSKVCQNAKVARRTGDVEEFGFEPIGDPQAKATAGQTTEDEQFVLASQTGLTGKLTVTIFASREEADAAWAARDMMDAHLLSSVQAGRSGARGSLGCDL